MPGETQSYDMAVIRDLLLAAFTVNELRRLVLYTSRPALKRLVNEFSSSDGLADMVEKTTTFCHKQDCLPDLLAEVKKVNSQQYARFELQLAVSGESVSVSSPSGTPSTQESKPGIGTLPGLQRHILKLLYQAARTQAKGTKSVRALVRELGLPSREVELQLAALENAKLVCRHESELDHTGRRTVSYAIKPDGEALLRVRVDSP